MHNDKKKIITISDNCNELINLMNILKPFYKTFPVRSAMKMFEVIDNIAPDLILLDMDMTNMDGVKAMAKLKTDKKYSSIPFIILTDGALHLSQAEGNVLFTADRLIKPVYPPILLMRIEEKLHLNQESAGTGDLVNKMKAILY